MCAAQTPGTLPAANLVAVAVRAVQDIAARPGAKAGEIRQFVAQAGGDQQPMSRNPSPISEECPKAAAPVGHQVGDVAGDDFAAVARHLAAPCGQQFGFVISDCG